LSCAPTRSTPSALRHTVGDGRLEVVGLDGLERRAAHLLGVVGRRQRLAVDLLVGREREALDLHDVRRAP
jgi:hypothetical protein